MTEDQIERQVERMIDHIDRRFLNGWMTQEEYDIAIWEVDRWAEARYRRPELIG
jgi:hypothetical protein